MAHALKCAYEPIHGHAHRFCQHCSFVVRSDHQTAGSGSVIPADAKMANFKPIAGGGRTMVIDLINREVFAGTGSVIGV